MRTALIFPGVEPAASRALAAVVYGTVTMLFGVLFSTDVSSSVKVPPQADERIAYDRHICGTARWPHAGRRPRQHHAHLVDEHGDFLGPNQRQQDDV